VHQGDFIPMSTGFSAPETTTTPRMTTTRDPGYTHVPSQGYNNNGNNLSSSTYTAINVASLQDTGISPQLARELQKIKDMVSSVPGIVQPIPEVSSVCHRVSRFASPICDAEIPKRFQTPSMKLYDGSTDPEEHVAQYREMMEINPIPANLKEACLCKGFGSTLTSLALKWLLSVPPYSITSFATFD